MADVRLRPMREDEYSVWYDAALETYAKEHAATGAWPEEEALERSRQEFGTLLPQGLASPGQHLYTILDQGRGDPLGMVWVAERGEPDTPHAFVYNIEIRHDQRGQGYGRAAMLALEQEVRALGLQRIALHVFGHNETALRLYERTGYRATNVLMAKDLG